MAEVPRHREMTDDDDAPERGASRRSQRGTYLLVAVLIVVALGVVVLHLTGVVGPGLH